MKKSFALVLTFLVVFASMLMGCTAEKQPQTSSEPGQTATPGAAAKKDLKLVFQTEPANLDPQVGTDTYVMIINNAVREGLVRYEAGKIVPGIAEKWDISPDGLTYTFHLRDSKWNDGSALTAQDFEKSFLRLLNPETNSQYAYIAYYIKNAQAYNTGKLTDQAQVGVKALDEKTLEVKLESPTKYFLSLMGFLSFLPSNPGSVEKEGEKYASDADKMLYNGPFILSKWNHQDSLVLEKNPNYWNKDAIKLDKVQISIVPEDKTAIGMYESGDIDMVILGRDYIEKYQKDGKAKIYDKGGSAFIQYNYDGTNGKLMSNPNFRQAISYAIDRDGIVNGLLKNGSSVAERYVPPATMGKEKAFGEEYPLQSLPAKADAQKAKEFMDKALQESGVASLPTIEFLASDKPNDKLIAEAIQDMLSKNLGLKLDVKIVQNKQKLQLMMKSDYQMLWAGWGPDYNDPMTYLDIFMSDSGYNTTSFKDAEYDGLIQKANQETDVNVRGDLLFQAEKYLLEKGPTTPVFFNGGAWASKDNLKNVQMNPLGAEIDFVFAEFQ